jgi:crossover junction endodeoxyribonuclease RusA
MIELILPWPPTVNHYWKLGRGHLYLGEEGKRYKAIVTGVVHCAGVRPFTGDVSLEIEAYPPDRRVRDIDNVLKAIFDSCGKAGLYADDSQVKHVEAWMREPFPRGRVIVRVADHDPDSCIPPSPVPAPDDPDCRNPPLAACRRMKLKKELAAKTATERN